MAEHSYAWCRTCRTYHAFPRTEEFVSVYPAVHVNEGPHLHPITREKAVPV